MPAILSDEVRKAFDHCQKLARAHYENFPVASRFLPAAKRPYVAALYAFARTADDFADEGTLPPQARLEKLDAWEELLHRSYGGSVDHPVFIALAETVSHHQIPPDPLRRLLKAFRADVTTHRFSTFQDLLGYCENSANPVGHLVLYLFERANPTTFESSDRICTGLQLANFWQDVSVDWDRGRLYVPLEDLERFGYTEAGFAERLVNDPFRRLMGFQVDRTRRYLRRGATLMGMVDGRLRLELALTVRGGLSILRRIERIGYDVLHRRPVLSWVDKMRIVYDAVLGRPLWKLPPQQ